MLDGGSGRRAHPRDRDLRRVTARRVELPDAEVALEYDGGASRVDRRPQHASVGEARDLPGRRVRRRRHLPDVLHSGAIGDEEQRSAVAGPHRPQLFRAAIGERAPR